MLGVALPNSRGAGSGGSDVRSAFMAMWAPLAGASETTGGISTHITPVSSSDGEGAERESEDAWRRTN
jgi:hypothetical protein